MRFLRSAKKHYGNATSVSLSDLENMEDEKLKIVKRWQDEKLAFALFEFWVV